MGLKLIKKGDSLYKLYEVKPNVDTLIGSNDPTIKIIENGKDLHLLLSLKNCQVIELGYDLDELADELASNHNNKYTLALVALRKGIELMSDSLQQTEWDVEIVMGGYRFNDDGEKIGFPNPDLPKLDADGCRMLKRK